jgi:hypothetical protein
MVAAVNFGKISGKVNNYLLIISPNFRQRRKLFISKSPHAAGGRRSVQQVKAKSVTISLRCISGPTHSAAKYSCWLIGTPERRSSYSIETAI